MDDVTIRIMQLAHKGLTCGQIIIKMALEDRGESNPDLVRAAAGLAYGCGSGHASCGALTAGCCVLGLYAGKSAEEQVDSGRLTSMLQELADWFSGHIGGERQGGITCNAIVGAQGPAAARSLCGALVKATYARVNEILAQNQTMAGF